MNPKDSKYTYLAFGIIAGLLTAYAYQNWIKKEYRTKHKYNKASKHTKYKHQIYT
jgi:hypothetical protein